MPALIWTISSAFLVSLFSFVGILTLSLKENLLKQIILLLVALSVGALMGGAFFHLIPKSVVGLSVDEIDVLFAYVIIGFTIFFLIEKDTILAPLS